MIDTKALREKVLDLAIRGKLVPQDPTDEPASVLLERIREQKKQMVKEGKLKAKDIKDDSIIFVGDDNLHYEKFADGSVKCIEDEIPFELPQGWLWTRVGNIASVRGGKRIPKGMSFSAEPTDHGYIRVTDMKNHTVMMDNLKYISDEVFSYIQNYTVAKNDLYITIAGTIGAVGEIPDELEGMNLTENAVKVSSVLINKHFLCLMLQSEYVQKQFKHKTYQVAMPKLGLERILTTLIPICNERVQQAVCKTINSVTEFVDALDANYQELQTLIGITKSKILDHAIRGQLVPQDPTDEPASVLLERIRAQKEELIKAGKIKRDKKESVIFKGDDNSYYEKIGNTDVCIDHKLPFTLPDGWTWCVLPEIAEIIMGSSPDGTTINNSNEGIEFHQGKIFFTNKMLNPSDKSTTQPSKIAPKDSVLLCVRAPVGELNITDRSICIGRGLASIHPYHYIDAEWLFYWLQTYKGYLNMKATGSTFVAITADIVKTILMPLPPLKEQEEILKTINKVFFIVDLIENSLN